MSSPVVSVIIPTYNRSSLLERAVGSVLNQTLEDIEVLVIDDASVDDTAAVIQRVDDPRMTYIRHEQNRGGAAARNAGIKRATGEYIAFLDDDDEFLPRKLEVQLAEFKSRSDDWVAAYCDYEMVETGVSRWTRKPIADRIGLREKAEGGEELIRLILLSNLDYGGASTLLIKRPIVEAIEGFDESFERYQDREFLLRLLQHGKMAYTDKTLVRRYETGAPSPAVCERAKQRYLHKFEDQITMLETAGHDVVGVHRFELARRYIADGQFRRGMWYLPSAKIQLLGLGWALLSGLASTVRRGDS